MSGESREGEEGKQKVKRREENKKRRKREERGTQERGSSLRVREISEKEGNLKVCGSGQVGGDKKERRRER